MVDHAGNPLQRALEQSPLPSALVSNADDLRHVTWCNAAFERITGIAPVSVQAGGTVLPQWLEASGSQCFSAAAHGREPCTFKSYQFLGFGRGFSCWTWFVVPANAPGTEQLLLQATDSTELVASRHELEQVEAESQRVRQALEKSQLRLNAALKAGGVGTWFMDIKEGTNTLDANLSAMLGLPAKEITLQVEAWLEFLHPDDRQRMSDSLVRALQGTQEFAEEFRVLRKDGSVRWFADAGQIVADATGQPRHLTGACVDVTEQRAARIKLQSVEANYRRLVESITDHGIIMFDAHRRITHWNKGAEQIFGYAPEEIMGKCADVLFSEEDRRNHAPEFEAEQAAARGRFPDMRWHVRKDGTLRFINGVVQPVHDEQRELIGYVKVVQDQTQQKEAEAEIRQAKEAAETANRAKDQFLAVLSHELRTPLNPVLMTVSLLETAPDLPEQVRKDILAIRENVELEARLIDDLLDLTRITRGKIELDRSVIDVHELLGHVVEICLNDASEKELTICTDFTASEYHVQGDVTRLRQVFWNLLKNAIKFSFRQGEVTIRTKNAGSRIVADIADAGIGVDPGKLPQIFDAFQQGDPATTRQFGGLGLGLTISRALVELHHGKIDGHSEGPGKGATFTVELDTVNAGEAPEQGTPERALPPHLPRSVLLVEDHEPTSRVMVRLLESLGCKVTLAASVADALNAAAKDQFDLVISDIGLPDGSGLDVMRSFHGNPQVKGIAVTGYGMESDIRQTADAGFQRHLTKPIDLQKLETAIREVAAAPP